jgi:hypothetical protein
VSSLIGTAIAAAQMRGGIVVFDIEQSLSVKK